jgi:hypothetical protein
MQAWLANLASVGAAAWLNVKVRPGLLVSKHEV